MYCIIHTEVTNKYQITLFEQIKCYEQIKQKRIEKNGKEDNKTKQV